jgi:hypothetical protein
MLLISTLLSILSYRTSGTTEEQLASHIAAGIRYYSQFNPNLVEDELDLVAEQAIYALPSGVMRVKRIDWWPWGQKKSPADLRRYEDLVMHPHGEGFSVISRDEIESRRCRWETEGTNLIIAPTPIADESVAIVYAYGHDFDASTQAYDTIPAEDDWLVANCALADYMTAAMSMQVVLPDFSEGMTSIRRGNISRSVPTVIQDLYKPLWERYGV